MLLLTCSGIADAYGAGFEFAPTNQHLNTLKGYVKHPKYAIGDGHYTDDTQLAAALAEHLTMGRPIERTAFAQSFLNAHNRDPRDGYSKRVKEALLTARNGPELVEILKPNKSNGNGACMRAGVIGFLNSPAAVMHVAAEQALATHDSVDGVESAQAIALASYGLRNGVARADIRDYLASNWIKVAKKGNHGEGGYTVWVALQALQSGNTLSEILRNAVSYGGDTDTVAAIAVGLATQTKEVGQTVPKRLLEGFERGRFGLNYLQTLDTLLAKL